MQLLSAHVNKVYTVLPVFEILCQIDRMGGFYASDDIAHLTSVQLACCRCFISQYTHLQLRYCLAASTMLLAFSDTLRDIAVHVNRIHMYMGLDTKLNIKHSTVF